MNRVEHRAAEWVYRGIWSVLVRWFRVPDSPPALPSGTADEVRAFRPADGFLHYLKLQFWIVAIVIDVILLGLWIALAFAWPLVGLLITPLALVLIVLPDVLIYIGIHLRYDTTWYVISDRSMRIRRGVWRIHETTLTYNNIQNVKITQGPLERYFGIANVVVQTAGGGGGDPHGGAMGPHVGRIEGVENAEEIRNLIKRRCQQATDSGLGDPEEASAQPVRSGWSPRHLQVLEEIAMAARQLN